MEIATSLVRHWLDTYIKTFTDDPRKTPYSDGILSACKSLLELLDKYEKTEGERIASNYGE